MKHKRKSTIKEEINKFLDRIEIWQPKWPELRRQFFRFVVLQKHKSWQDAYLTARTNVIEENQEAIRKLEMMQKNHNCPTHKPKRK